MNDKVQECVVEWCHSEGSPRADTNIRTVHKVILPNRLDEGHPQLIWEEVTWDSRWIKF